jgi:hypothetical protein
VGVITTADEHVQDAQKLVLEARQKIGEVLLDRKMWGADSFRDGYIKNLFDRLDALTRAFEGEDRAGEQRASEIPPP